MENASLNPIVNLRGVSLSRGGTPLLRDLNWEVRRGEHWTVLGPNGAGKTLLLRVVTGYIWPTDGEVTVLGKRLGRVDLRILRRKIGWVSQALADLTPGGETLLGTILSGPMASLGLYADPEPALVEKARQTAADFGLSDKLERPFFLLSSGERQRALLARAALTEPDLLILDEPMSNLDMGGRELFLELTRRLASAPNGPTVILTTHNTLEIGPFFSHALLLKNGAVLAQGELERTLTSPILSAAFELPLKVERSAGGRVLALLNP
ncbi:MAG: ATP-binding cassette domain-containing protein [Deltaproteobacteria bacterium]|jgi:iron complex transport system ATP-binding protein|nr:ATP-binding cassette domain-containing protein [Deltaproteobacteria bacterium]